MCFIKNVAVFIKTSAKDTFPALMSLEGLISLKTCHFTLCIKHSGVQGYTIWLLYALIISFSLQRHIVFAGFQTF